MLTPIARGLSELVFPSACAGCDKTISSQEGEWCVDCARELLEITPRPYCPCCGLAAGEYMFDESGCPNCRHTRIKPAGFVRVGTYHDLVGQTLRRFKFKREHRLDACLGRLIADAMQGQAWHREIDAVVPVPTTWRSRLKYRAWPVWLLAAQVGRRLHVPTLPLLYTQGKKRRQVGLARTERPVNIRGVFHVSRHANVTGATLCVVDDVSTTESTINETVRVLLEAGAARVYAAVLAKTEPHQHDDDPV